LSPEKLVGRFRDKPLEFQPGEKWSYSNSGYVLLGYLLEKVSGQSYESFVGENIFRAAGDEGFGVRFELGDHPAGAAGYQPGRTGRRTRVSST